MWSDSLYMIAVMFGATLAATVAAKGTERLSHTAPPHIFLVVGDDMGWANVGWHNANYTHTPNMNELVKRGIELDRHYVFFYCSPSRSSMLSGRLPIHVTENNGYACTIEGACPRNMTTIAQKLKEVGYKTHQIGKWHLGQVHEGSLPASRGFDSSFGYLGGAEDHYENTNGGCGNCGKHKDLWRTNQPASGEVGGEYAAYKYNREMLKLINDHADNDATSPMFMYLALQCAHAPNQADKYAGLFSGGDYTSDYANYNGMISAIDDTVGNLTKVLKSRGMWQNSLIVFTSDNGGPSAKSVSGSAANNWPLRGGKHTAWEGGHRVAAFVAGGVVPKPMRGQKLTGYVHGADWYATFASLANVTDDPTDTRAEQRGMPATDSINMWPYLSGGVPSSPRLEVPLASFQADKAAGGGDVNGSAALIVGKYKLVRFAQQYCFWTGPLYPNASTTHAEDKPCNPCGEKGCLFDIFQDPAERVDLASTLPNVAARMLDRAHALDLTSIEYVRGPGWRGSNDKDLACKDCTDKYGGFWGPDLEL